MSARYLTIRIDADAGEADLIATNSFHAMSGLWRMDVLQDVIGMAEALYSAAYEDFGHGLSEAVAAAERK